MVDALRDEENSNPAQSADGRSLIDFTSAIVHQNGSIDKLTDRAYNGAIKLPASGSYTSVLAAPKATEAEDPQIASLRRAKAITDAASNMQQAAQNAAYQACVDQINANNAAVANASNLQPTTSPITGARQWTVKTDTNR